MQLLKRTIILALAVLLMLLVAGTFVDLPLSKAVYNPQSLYGRFFEVFGEFPGMLVAAFGFAGLLVTRRKKTALSNVGALVGYGLPLALFSFLAALVPLHYLLGGVSLLVPALALLFAAAAVFAASRVPAEQREALRRAALVAAFTFVFALFIVNTLKNFWGRPRFRSMEEPFVQFLAWYLPQGSAAGEEFRSFPSGHSTSSAVVMCIALLPTFIPPLKNRQTLLFLLGLTWAGLTMFSRIVMGAHFLSDVAAGALVTLLTFFLLCKAAKVSD